MKTNVEWIVEAIEEHCEKREYFWAVGLIKETLDLWVKPQNLELLSFIPQSFAEHYLQQAIAKAEGRE